MRTVLSMLVVVALGGCFATVGEDGQMVGGGGAAFTVSLPEVLPLVVVQPGVSVARDMDEEIFYTDGYYWARQDQTWFRARDHRGTWARVEARRVPAPIFQSPPGRYRYYRGNDQYQRSDQTYGRRDGSDDRNRDRD